ncbi:MAG: glucosamine-6-phosphate deaminase [Lewinellaceae bacterium]|nr:glucosamine-6-phosphate deaminase [Lewinellaceae bacterium]
MITTALKYQFRSLENIPVKIWSDAREGSLHIAQSIALAIRQRQQDGERLVLGLATGSSPIRIYEELVRMHREEGLSFNNVVTFNLDEYYPLAPEAQQSYVRFMGEYFFDHIDIPKENIHIPDGRIPMPEVANYCAQYERLIDHFGGIDIQLLGIGRTGHIGFNEPGSWENSLTRMVRLDSLTRRDAIKDFLREEDVPYRALTMGIGSIFKAKTIYLMAWGMHKADILREAVEGPVNSVVPASYLQKHPNVKVYADEAAAAELTRMKAPWLVGMCNWSEDLICKAVVWLSQKTGKPILKLTDTDYSENHLSELTVEYDNAYNINIRIFNSLQHTITGWPGGKPNADDTHRPERAQPARKRVIIFSPHPDDDVISMGGTFLRLVEQGHDVHVAYQTSGNLAVHDYDARRYIEFLKESSPDGQPLERMDSMLRFLDTKAPDQSDTEAVRHIKGLIRRGEARAGARFAGLPDDHIHFLDMPFYETGRARKKPLGEEDVRIVVALMEQIKPHQVYAAGDLADPHGTHRVCLESIFEAFGQLGAGKPQNDEKTAWIDGCWLWMYRGAWHEWNVDEIEMAVPLSPMELEKKRKAIYMHQSQKDRPPFPGDDHREFWQRAEERNQRTAQIYRQLGLAEYEAMEAFRRWKF